MNDIILIEVEMVVCLCCPGTQSLGQEITHYLLTKPQDRHSECLYSQLYNGHILNKRQWLNYAVEGPEENAKGLKVLILLPVHVYQMEQHWWSVSV